ncbi:hypothetical protein Y032_0651g1143 [Ancylostoma ceylanicum]|uniref:Uncharacterized protein n=1 Tax=Ancylostoma ceylanicum TaxID=53326 RepID=A0A016WJY2_9BILA|nr:hypothetical protein Y032_0651g1143 [Ancylostoma ceylanicum]
MRAFDSRAPVKDEAIGTNLIALVGSAKHLTSSEHRRSLECVFDLYSDWRGHPMINVNALSSQTPMVPIYRSGGWMAWLTMGAIEKSTV